MSAPAFATPTEFMKAHEANMQRTVPFGELPFFKWMGEQKEPPDRFVAALFGYYHGHAIKGAFTDDEITSYKHIYEEFWRQRHQRAGQRADREIGQAHD